MNIILFEPSEPAPDSSVFLLSRDFRTRHIRSVLHADCGRSLRAGIIDGVAGTAVIVSDTSEGLRLMFYPDTGGTAGSTPRLHCERSLHQEGANAADIHVIVGSVRPIQLKRLLRDLSSFAVKSVTVAGARLSEASYFHASMWEQGRLRALLVEGAMQGGHTRLPEVRRVNSVAEATGVYEEGPDMLRVYLDQSGSPAGASRARWRGEATVIAVGPERGFTEAEKKTLIDCAFEPVGIPGGILRSETAAIAGVAAIRACVPTE